ncbi:hypothetical protein [Haloarcula brevis]|uniref:hypothetical protein n=1 Tax=Haloarcula brevis TaxID=3111453 RepID=UPI00300F0CC4
MGERLPDWVRSKAALREQLKKYPGFEAGYEHYLYVLEFEREDHEDPYYYVGKTSSGEDGLFQEIQRRARNPFTFQRPIDFKGFDVLTTHRKDEYNIIDIERIKTLNNPPEAMGDEFANEGERKLAYQISIEYNTTNVLGGK